MPVTIKEVGKRAGCSFAAASHILNRNDPRYSDKMRQRVVESAKELGYVPHRAAQSLATGKTMTLGVLIREMTDQYCPLHIQAIEGAATRRGYRLSLGITGTDEEKVRTYLDHFTHGQADGILIVTSKVSDAMLLDLIEQGYPVGTPLRVIDGHEELSGIQLDIGRAFLRLLEYLYDLEHRQFGFLCGIPAESPRRYKQMHDFVEEKSIDFGPERETTDIERLEAAEPAARKLLRQCPQITALVCSNDVLAFGAIAAAHELGLDVPGDLSITGFDDVPISRFSTPRLTTVRIPIARIAAADLDNLVDRIEGLEPAPIQRLTPELLVRGSTGPPKKGVSRQ